MTSRAWWRAGHVAAWLTFPMPLAVSGAVMLGWGAVAFALIGVGVAVIAAVAVCAVVATRLHRREFGRRVWAERAAYLRRQRLVVG